MIASRWHARQRRHGAATRSTANAIARGRGRRAGVHVAGRRGGNGNCGGAGRRERPVGGTGSLRLVEQVRWSADGAAARGSGAWRGEQPQLGPGNLLWGGHRVLAHVHHNLGGESDAPPGHGNGSRKGCLRRLCGICLGCGRRDGRCQRLGRQIHFHGVRLSRRQRRLQGGVGTEANTHFCGRCRAQARIDHRLGGGGGGSGGGGEGGHGGGNNSSCPRDVQGSRRSTANPNAPHALENRLHRLDSESGLGIANRNRRRTYWGGANGGLRGRGILQWQSVEGDW